VHSTIDTCVDDDSAQACAQWYMDAYSGCIDDLGAQAWAGAETVAESAQEAGDIMSTPASLPSAMEALIRRAAVALVGGRVTSVLCCIDCLSSRGSACVVFHDACVICCDYCWADMAEMAQSCAET